MWALRWKWKICVKLLSNAFRLFGWCRLTVIFHFIRACVRCLVDHHKWIFNCLCKFHATKAETKSSMQRVEETRAREKTYQTNYAWRSMGSFATNCFLNNLFLWGFFKRWQVVKIKICRNSAQNYHQKKILLRRLTRNRFMVQPLHRHVAIHSEFM